MTNASGGVVSAMRSRGVYAHYPYGEVRASSGTVPTDRRFTGQREETGLGLYDYVARRYDPLLGRFIQADTIVPNPANPQALNRYAYTYNNALRYTDPSGHEPADWFGFASGMVTQFTRDMVFWVSADTWMAMDALAVVVSQEPPPAAYYEGQEAGRNLSKAVGTAMLIQGGANVVAGLSAMASTGSGGAACAVATGGTCAIPAGALLAGEGALVGLGALEALYGGLVLASTQDPIHHIATNKNYKRPPQWSQQFEDLFAKVRKAVWVTRRLRFPTCVGCIAILL